MEMNSFNSPLSQGGGYDGPVSQVLSSAMPTADIMAEKGRMVGLGFPDEWSEVALIRCGGAFEDAIRFIYAHGANMDQIVQEERMRQLRLNGHVQQQQQSVMNRISPSAMSGMMPSPPGGMMPPLPPQSMNYTPQMDAMGGDPGVQMNGAGGHGSGHGHRHNHGHGHRHTAQSTPSAPSSSAPSPQSSSKKPAAEEEVKDIATRMKEVVSSTSFILTCMWLGWLMMGTVFYGVHNGYHIGQAFYMSVNVGYSIGWGYPFDVTVGSKIFSVFYVLMGSSAISAALGMFAAKMVADNDSWFEDAVQLKEFNRKMATETPFNRLLAWIEFNADVLKPVALWFVWVFTAVIWYQVYVDDVFIDALYFAISSMSTGGLWAIPADAPDWQYGLVGAFAATGCPLMALAMATVASFFIETEDPDETNRKILSPVTQEEIDMMNKFGLENGDGEVDQAEYIILCMVRIGAVAPDLVKFIIERFKALDHSGDGSLSYAELMQEHDADGNHVTHDDEEVKHHP